MLQQEGGFKKRKRIYYISSMVDSIKLYVKDLEISELLVKNDLL